MVPLVHGKWAEGKTLAVGTVTTLAAGATATVTNSGTAGAAGVPI